MTASVSAHAITSSSRKGAAQIAPQESTRSRRRSSASNAPSLGSFGARRGPRRTTSDTWNCTASRDGTCPSDRGRPSVKQIDSLGLSLLHSDYAPTAASETASPERNAASSATSEDSNDSDDVELEEVGYLLNLQQRREIHARYNRRIQPGESVCVSYAWDMSRCECKSTHRACGVPVMPVARMDGRDRCLQCGKSWRPPVEGDRRKGRQFKKGKP